MNHIQALAIARTRQQGHLEAARGRHVVQTPKPSRPVRRTSVGEMLRASLVFLRARVPQAR